jgi:hypothetical protein
MSVAARALVFAELALRAIEEPSPTRPPIAPPIPTHSIPPLQPIRNQVPVLYVTIVYAVVIFAVWNIPGVRVLIGPLKLFTIGLHELCHIVAAVLTGGTVTSVSIDPFLGGVTIVEGGHPSIILTAGYLGSTMFGGVLILGGWDTLIAKVLSFVIGIGLVMPLVLAREKLTILLTILYEALLIGFWFIAHAQPLRWYCLFLGVMSILYVIWDVADDRFFHKANDSDAVQFSLLFPRIPAHVWATFWIIFQFAILSGFSLLGIYAFKKTTQEMNAEASVFLPT